MSLRELARRLHVSASLVSQIETGKAQPSVRTLYAIVNELGLSLDEVLDLASREPARTRQPTVAPELPAPIRPPRSCAAPRSPARAMARRTISPTASGWTAWRTGRTRASSSW